MYLMLFWNNPFLAQERVLSGSALKTSFISSRLSCKRPTASLCLTPPPKVTTEITERESEFIRTVVFQYLLME
jgi:hypothetical protein